MTAYCTLAAMSQDPQQRCKPQMWVDVPVSRETGVLAPELTQGISCSCFTARGICTMKQLIHHRVTNLQARQGSVSQTCMQHLHPQLDKVMHAVIAQQHNVKDTHMLWAEG